MQNWITNFMEQFGYIGILLLMCLENVFPPIPSELILPFGGFMTTHTDLHVVGVILSATAGSLLGAAILFRIGLFLDVERLLILVDKWGKYLHVKQQDVLKADAWFDKHGNWTVLFCRMIPFIRSMISIPAGMSNMNVRLFIVFTTIGTLIWNSILVTTGAILGNSWDVVLHYMGIYSTFIYMGIGILSLILLVVFLKKRWI